MSQPRFIHLRMHSEYSILDGMVRLDQETEKSAQDNRDEADEKGQTKPHHTCPPVEAAIQDDMPALALTDLCNLFGMVKLYRAARVRGIKPIIGCDVWLTNETNRDQPYRALLLCSSRTGYSNLCLLLTRAYRENQYRGRAEINKRWFTRHATEGLIALSGAHHGDVGQALMQNNFKRAETFASQWRERCASNFYIELQRLGNETTSMHTELAIDFAAKLGLSVVATHPIQFLHPDDFKAHETRVCIAQGYVLADPRRPKEFTIDQYFKTQDEMAQLFSDVPEALQNSVEIAKRCNLSIELGVSRLPQFPTPNNVGLDPYLREQSNMGLQTRIQALYPDPQERIVRMPTYHARLEFELNTIVQMGFAGYFLIVADFINWAKHNSIPVGPGRGSGAGSLVAYSLGITDLDPLRYDLLFERFLNPERVSMPDFDIDFCQDGRERVIDYVKHKYGADSVSQIATFGTMAAKAVVRDVGRVLDLPYSFCDQLAKLIPNQLGMTLKKARGQEPLLNERAAKEEEVQELLELAGRLEGLTRNVGMHAGGVLIAPGKLSDYCPLYVAEGSESAISQFDKDDVESIGLVKFDFLGLRTLTILDWTQRYIRAQGGKWALFSLDDIPQDDPATYGVFGSGNTTAVFQSESRGMKDLMRRLKPDCFDDIVALMALYRPGPLQSGMVDDFIKRKRGAQVDYLHPDLETILKPTYGVIVYQEQVMQIAQILAGYSLGAADLLRRAMGKKKAEEMAQHRSMFVNGAVARGVPHTQAQYLFDLMEKFAEYGFNKSHSAAYAVVAYQTAYLKANHTAAFLAAALSSDMDDTDKIKILYEDARANGIKILGPDINLSDYRFAPLDEKRIRYGLGALKGTGEAAINGILKARAERPFTDFFDFCQRADKHLINRRVIEALIRGGAFDTLHANRASLLASLVMALESAEQSSREASQTSLFDSADPAEKINQLARTSPWSQKESLQNEKMSLGFYFSGHPFSSYRNSLSSLLKAPLIELEVKPQTQWIAGLISSVRTLKTESGRMAFVTLEDETASVDVRVPAKLFDVCRGMLKEDQLVFMQAKVSLRTRRGEGDFTEEETQRRVHAEAIYDLSGAMGRFAKSMHLYCNGQADAQKLVEILAPYRPGNCTVEVVFRNDRASCSVQLGKDWQVDVQDSLVQSLTDWLHEENVLIRYQQ
jgi:DNA polymerase-3 subunit alpha